MPVREQVIERHVRGARVEVGRWLRRSAIFVWLALPSCARARTEARAQSVERAPIDGASEAGRGGVVIDPGPVRTVDVPVAGDLPAVVVRGARAHRLQMLFIPGMCVHPAGYVMSFQHTAAARGDLVALQGDVSCGGDGSMRRWSYDLDALNRRIDAAFLAAELGQPRRLVVIGYSQGAELAERLAARWPAKYRSAVLIASPIMPSAARLAKTDVVVLMAGTRDSQTTSRGALRGLQTAKITSSFLPLPGARHGEMGDHPEDTMREVLDFVESASTERDGGSAEVKPTP